MTWSYPDIEWDWDTIDTKDIHFPSNFAWGTATAAHQVEGNNTNNNWYQWEHSFDEDGNSRIHNADKSGIAVDHWNRYSDDITLMQNIGVNHYRFSVEWSRIEPIEGNYDLDALLHYRKICEALIDANITPVITLHHFTHPIWFEEMGAFEDDRNIDYFLRFSELVFTELMDLVPIWLSLIHI